ncbi:MAG TPA: T9SS type A sorting domain-containing protein [Puia sp.]|uniref:T9SS type A sorting domain-containing protein n=1 Tax=Puia sp. TaxID=2045100 RepID=UPI002C5EEA1F|nr:T9SS type A sorting domain-containing protein [Puia sp.]HVU97623.1 T9SS type A sorting domain-containing protein [Puia sp.]
MKKFYTLVCAGFLFSFSASAQGTPVPGFTGGKFTAVAPTDFRTTAGWVGGVLPPSTFNPGSNNGQCNNCQIDLEVVGGGTVTLNAGLLLTGGSELLIGPGTTLLLPPSGATNPLNGNGIDLTDQNPGGQVNRIVWADGTAKLDASQLTSTDIYDGVYTSIMSAPGVTPQTFDLTKQIGVAPNGFHAIAGGAVTQTSSGTPQYGNGLGINGPITLANTNGIISLPIIVSSFTANLIDQNVVNLAWTTALESNADHFAIQRSADAGAHWATLGTVSAKGGTTATDYTYSDSKPANGTSEYRLQLVDKDGTYKYSEVRTIRNGLINAVSVFPNPAHDYVNVALGGKATENILIRLYNQNGQLIQLKNVANAGGSTVPLSVSGYSEGTYFIVVNGADGSKQVSKFLISK